MKTRYQKLTKEEKKNIKNEYYNTEIGKTQKYRFIKLYIYGIMGLFISAYLIYDNLKTNYFWEYSLAGLLILASLFFIIGSYLIRRKSLNNYTLKKFRKSSK